MVWNRLGKPENRHATSWICFGGWRGRGESEGNVVHNLDDKLAGMASQQPARQKPLVDRYPNCFLRSDCRPIGTGILVADLR